MKKRILFIFSCCWFFAAQAQSQANLIKVTDLLQVKQIGAVALSPDGKQVAFTVTATEPGPVNKNEHRFITQIYLAPASGTGEPRALTTAKESSTAPAWSPNGQQLAFVRTVESKPQIFLMSLNGGEPQQLTNFKYGANTPRWSPDGRQLLFTSGISLKDLVADSLLNPGRELPKWSYEKPGLFQNENLKVSGTKADPNGSLAEVRRYLDQNEKDNKAKVINQLQFQEEAGVSGNLNLSHIFLVDAQAGASPKDLTPGFYSSFNPRFTPDGKKIFFEGTLDEALHPNRAQENKIFSMAPDGSGLKPVLGKKDVSYTGVVVSPGGKWLALQYAPTTGVNLPRLAIMPVGGTEADIITIPWDRDKSNLTWAQNDQQLYLTSTSNGGVVLCRVAVKDKKVQRLTDYNSGVTSFDVHGNKLVFVKTEVANPSDLYLADTNVKNSRRLTSFNYNWLKDKKLSLPEKKTFTNPKGQTVEYWVMKPTNFEAGKRYPLLLEIHGGPSAMWGPGEAGMWHEYQYFCAQGFGVVYANPRGSGGYGEEFLRGNVQDWGAGPASDVLTALDKTVAEGWADKEQLLLTGGSYGGYLVTWILGHDNRFKAACSQRGVYELSTFFGEGNAWRLVPNYFGGYPWEEKTKGLLARESPLTYVENIKTPLIIFHGEQDLRTGVIQSETLYKSLKVLNRPVEYVRHPGATHEITRSGNNRQRIDQMLRTYEFFERWLNKPTAAK